ncbi:MAG: HNH endonuclease [Gammaproteobacteria bacterium]
MPYAPKPPCRAPMCAHLAERGGYSSVHWTVRTQAYNQARGSSTTQGYGARWRRLRLLVLARDPVCRICQRAPSTDVDHIIPKRRGGADDPSNLQGLCSSCHARKTALTDAR